MADDSPRGVAERFFRVCLFLLGGIVALWLGLELLAHIWGWLLLALGIALVLWCGVTAYRYWWGRR
ncbi:MULTISPECIES: hypothetical protein [unclassified Microbacterium]|uniref:hypothetical protein n=1 Tax=unclassified Microbacterium TaxID=2609290 RepID=UPI003653A4B4